MADRPTAAALADLSVPGASGPMQDWQRDAVREAFEFLRDAGRADAGAVVDAVYPTHEAGFDGEDGEPWRLLGDGCGQRGPAARRDEAAGRVRTARPSASKSGRVSR